MGELPPLVNGLAVVAGAGVGSLGLRLGAKSQALRTASMQAVSLSVVAIGLRMTFSAPLDPLLVTASMVLGTLVGQGLSLEERLDEWSEQLRRRVGGQEGFAQGFTLATLIFCVGPMAILGALESGLRGQGGLLYAKSLLDGITGLFLATSFGWGVILAALPVWLYEGLLALGAAFLAPLLMPSAIQGLTQTGGLLVLGIGLNVLLSTRIRVASMLPALVFGAALSYLKVRYHLPV
jgi:uncharacterized membrane protein YqgA involved in biofilm formation